MPYGLEKNSWPKPAPAKKFPPLDKRLVKPEVTREEMVRGERMYAEPADPPHALMHVNLDTLVKTHVHNDYEGAADMLTRVGKNSDFATDTSIKRKGIDEATGERHLEELAFEIVNKQSKKSIRDRAELLIARGVRRVFAIFVKTGKVAEWSPQKKAFVDLKPSDVIEDRTLAQPIRVRAILDSAEVENDVVRALLAKNTPALLEALEKKRREGLQKGLRKGLQKGLQKGQAEFVILFLRDRFGELPDVLTRRIRSMDASALEKLFPSILSAPSLEDISIKMPIGTR